MIHRQFEDGNEDILLLYVFIPMFIITAQLSKSHFLIQCIVSSFSITQQKKDLTSGTVAEMSQPNL